MVSGMDPHDCKCCMICINLYWASQLTCHQRWSSKWGARLSFSNFHVVGVCWDCQAPLPLCLTLCLSIVTSLVGSFQALCVCLCIRFFWLMAWVLSYWTFLRVGARLMRYKRNTETRLRVTLRQGSWNLFYQWHLTNHCLNIISCDLDSSQKKGNCCVNNVNVQSHQIVVFNFSQSNTANG